jgi:Peptidase family C25/Propeptide_C25/FlgD Ig-like domain
MNKSLFLIILSILSFSILNASPVWHPFDNNISGKMVGITVPNSDNYKTTITIDIPGFYSDEEVVEGLTYHHISIPVGNGGTLTQTGSPQLPVIARFIAIPSDRDPEIRIIEQIEETFTGYNVYPVQPPLPENKISNIEFKLDEKRYSTDAFYPDAFVTANEPAIIRDYRVLPLIIQPVRYNPVTKELIIVKHLKIELVYNKFATQNVKIHFHSRISKTFEPLYRNFILNYDFVRPPQNPVDGTYLIITHDDFYSAVQPLAGWKQHKGWRTKIVKTSDIAPNPTSTQIYDYIHNAYLNWPLAPDYVLLVGDIEFVPCGYGVNSDATDHYYTKQEGTDYFSDLLVARVSVKNLTEAQTVINKLVNYESNPFIDSIDWYRKATTIAGYEGTSRFWTVCIRIMNRLLAYGYTQVDTLFQRWGQATPTNVANAVNQGRSFVLYRGHGDVDGWYNVEPAWVNSHVQALNNGRKLPMVIGPTCESGHFDDASQDCHAEVWLKVGTPTQEKGSCGYFGASRVSYSGYNDSLAAGTFLGYCDSTLFTFAQSTNFGKLFMYRAYPEPPGSICEEESDMFNNFGEPELNIWSAPPQQLTVNHPAVIMIGSFPFTVTVMAGGPVEDALVCVMSKTDTSIYLVDRTNSAGQADFLINSTTPGDSIFVTVTGRNLYPYQGVALTVAPNTPYVTFLRYIINDSTGNNDRIVNPGEEIELPLWVKNWGGFAADAVTGKITTSDTLVVVTDSTKNFGTIAANDSAFTGTDGYNFTVAPNCCNGYTIRFNLELCDALDSIWNSFFSVTVGTPVLVFEDKIVYDSQPGGNNNGRIDPGETSDLAILLRNTGLGNGYNLSAILKSGDSRLTVLDSIGSFGTINSDTIGSNQSDPFSVQADNNIPQETQIPCTLHILGDDGYSATCTFVIVIGEIRTIDPIPDGPRQPPLFWAYDNTDCRYEYYPTYDWTEIKTLGTQLNFPQNDDVLSVPLPAAFGAVKFYGNRFTTLSISADGFVVFGTDLTQRYTNYSLPNSQAPAAFIALNWDDLYPNYSGSGYVYHFHDIANHRFIIEYDSVPYYSPRTVMDKFELIIYDTTIVTSNGDNVLVAQYMTSNGYSGSTIGIQDPTRTIAIQYLFDGSYHQGAAPMAAARAIKYITGEPMVPITESDAKPSLLINLLRLEPCSPNPFQARTIIKYNLPVPTKASLRIYNTAGRLVTTLFQKQHDAGYYSVTWDARDNKGKKFANGIYFYELETPNQKLIRKMILVK